MRIDGISALVTGGASGLGLATARRLVDKGAARVVLLENGYVNGHTVRLDGAIRMAPR